MYSDIIPPKKKYTPARSEEYNSVRFSSPHPTYRQPSQTKKPVILFLAACVIIGVLVYHNLAQATDLTIAPKVTRFDIKQNIPLILQGREDKSLTYSLVYVPATTGGSTRNPFTPAVTATTTASSSTPTNSIKTTITASTTGDTKRITIINASGSSVPLRKETRFDVGGVVYTLDEAITSNPSEKKVLDKAKLVATSSIYRVMGFKGFGSYDTVYAIPEMSENGTTTGIAVGGAVSTVPPKELLSLMPAGTLALQKSTVYDKLLGQSALVVFEQTALEAYLHEHITQTQEYYKALNAFGESVTFDIVILDYTVLTSNETGKPTALSSLSLEITPKINPDTVVMQFAGFSRDTMSTVEKQTVEFVGVKTKYTPFWSKSVAKKEKIDLTIQQ